MRASLRFFSVAMAVVALLLALPSVAEEPPNVTFSPSPLGAVQQSQLVYLAGEAMHSQWRAIVSKKQVGSSSGTTFYQWYLSIYSIDDTTYKLRYQSPQDGGPMTKVARAKGAPMWFPIGELSVIGTGELMQPGVQQLVVQSHQMAADCGAAAVTVFAYDPKTNKVVPAVSIGNGCELSATVVHGKVGDAMLLSGPYYGPNAALCCPTKPKAKAMLAYRNGTWYETPNYFKLYPNGFAP